MQEQFLRKVLIPKGYENINTWPNVDLDALYPDDRIKFKKYKEAVRSYFIGQKSLKEIEKDSGISISEVSRRAKRCLEVHDDGLIWGYRALIPRVRIKKYTRKKLLNLRIESTGGDSGAFSHLLETYPTLKEFIYQRVIKKKRKGNVRIGKLNLKAIHNEFIKEIMKLGIKGYPLDRKEQGLNTFYAYTKKLKTHHQKENAEITYGPDVANTLIHTGKGDSPKPVDRCFKRVECDEHKIDLIITLLVPLPNGGYKYITLDRIWVIVIEDVKSRSVIGYYISFKSHVNALDIIRAIARCFESHPRHAVVIPELNSIRGGLPVDINPELQWVAFDEISFDRDATHKAIEVKDKLKDVIGSRIVMGEAHLPITRPYIEQFFRLLEDKLHQLPNTTGSHHRDPSSVNPEGEALKHGLTVEEIIELLDTCLAEYNVDSKRPVLGYRSSLEVLEQDIEIRKNELIPYRKIPLNLQKHISVIGQEFPASIVNRKGRSRPYINFLYVPYSSDLLSNSPSLVSKRVKLLVDPDNLCFFEVYLDSGESIGTVKARGDWGYIPHSIETRRNYFKDHKKQDRQNQFDENALSTYLMVLAEKSLASRQAGSLWAHGMQTIYSKMNLEEFDNINDKIKRQRLSSIKYEKKKRVDPKRHSTRILNQ